ncbi:TlyA family RNA methyltransferase [Oryzomicrobium sp.]|uniref:TlyA family RNA methyltransferase n=1 Tax=Oryzomicrobium sp. TaxID=1911578 RepID=UPI002FDFC82F
MTMDSFHRRAQRAAPAHKAPASHARPAGRQRADQALVARGLAESRTAAQRLIAAGRVLADLGKGWEAVAKPSLELADDTPLQLLPGDEDRYVSRGGLKLAGALAACAIDPAGQTCLDLGQSTGGFTDCLLHAGAARVVGVEVGHGQIHPRLAGDPRVVTLEGINARALSPADLGEHFPAAGFDLIVGDLSFISLTLILPRVPALLAPGGTLLLLVKPQFEVGPDKLAKGGLVKDATLYPQVEARIRAAAADLGLTVHHYVDSPITGGDGNREFFIHAGRA